MFLFFKNLDDGPTRCPRFFQEVRGSVQIVGSEDNVDVPGALNDRLAVFLGKAAGHRYLQVWVRRFLSLQLAQMTIETVIGVLPDAAGVHDDDICLGDVVNRLHSVGFEHAGDPLGIVLVHLTAERLYVVAPRHELHCTDVAPLGFLQGPWRKGALTGDATLATTPPKLARMKISLWRQFVTALLCLALLASCSNDDKEDKGDAAAATSTTTGADDVGRVDTDDPFGVPETPSTTLQPLAPELESSDDPFCQTLIDLANGRFVDVSTIATIPAAPVDESLSALTSTTVEELPVSAEATLAGWNEFFDTIRRTAPEDLLDSIDLIESNVMQAYTPSLRLELSGDPEWPNLLGTALLEFRVAADNQCRLEKSFLDSIGSSPTTEAGNG